MNHTENVRLILLQEFIKSQTRNPNYSMRAYAKKVGIAQSAISEIFSGKRPITKKAGRKILEGLNVEPDRISKILGAKESESARTFRPVDMDTFHIIADWHYYAILSLAETDDFDSSDVAIAARLGISKKMVSTAVAKLLQLNMLRRDERSKRLVPTGEQFQAISEIASSALKKANRQNLDLAQTALEEVDVKERDFTAITLCFDPDRIEDARKMIRNFRRNFNDVMEAGHKKEVFKLCVQLFPLTKRRNK